ncbi:delta(7)-sterol 5(6)-desaturase Erg3p [Trichomonascus vanleenenianus]|uniref:C-5 sterol desaturase n=1 Tax=Trichomonascus vanleenenianus TaxID=2268995 RepID=UPI003ECB278B
MDLVLEVADYYLLDKAYAKVLPASGPVDIPAVLNTTVYKGFAGLIDFESFSEEAAYGAPYLFPANEFTYASALLRDSIVRQTVSMFLVAVVFAYIVYFGAAIFSYYVVFDQENFKHPKMLKNQVVLEIKQACSAIPVMTALTVPWFVLELRGHSKLYWNPYEYGQAYLVLQFVLYIMFTDMCIYFIHRWLHWPSVYKHLHKPHHKWIVPTPFASFAFHPVDGYAQSLPYHVFPFIFPLHKLSYLVLFAFVTIWTVMIHDGEYMANNPVVNGSACHTIHHLYFNYNYGQYTTLWDRLGGSHRTPDKELFDRNTKMSTSTWKKQSKQMEEIKKVVEGDSDDRVYLNEKKEK